MLQQAAGHLWTRRWGWDVGSGSLTLEPCPLPMAPHLQTESSWMKKAGGEPEEDWGGAMEGRQPVNVQIL